MSLVLPDSVRGEPLSNCDRALRTLAIIGHVLLTLVLALGAWLIALLLVVLLAGLCIAAHKTRGRFEVEQMPLLVWLSPHAGWRELVPSKAADAPSSDQQG